jgi:hypothetical protein
MGGFPFATLLHAQKGCTKRAGKGETQSSKLGKKSVSPFPNPPNNGGVVWEVFLQHTPIGESCPYPPQGQDSVAEVFCDLPFSRPIFPSNRGGLIRGKHKAASWGKRVFPPSRTPLTMVGVGVDGLYTPHPRIRTVHPKPPQGRDSDAESLQLFTLSPPDFPLK